MSDSSLAANVFDGVIESFVSGFLAGLKRGALETDGELVERGDGLYAGTPPLGEEEDDDDVVVGDDDDRGFHTGKESVSESDWSMFGMELLKT